VQAPGFDADRRRKPLILLAGEWLKVLCGGRMCKPVGDWRMKLLFAPKDPHAEAIAA
jgi:hypothetical protein